MAGEGYGRACRRCGAPCGDGAVLLKLEVWRDEWTDEKGELRGAGWGDLRASADYCPGCRQTLVEFLAGFDAGGGVSRPK